MPHPTCSVSFPTCAWCGIVFSARAGGTGYKRATCNPECKRLWELEKRRVAPRPVRRVRNRVVRIHPVTACPTCGMDVPPSAGTKPRTYCSDACRVARNRAAAKAAGRAASTCTVSFPTCLICEAIFAARAGGAGYRRSTCSDACFRLWRNAIERERHANLSPERRQARLARKMVRRALEAGVNAERFTHREVFERDGWICGLCETAVDSALAHPDPMSASLDHVIPIKLGGPHTRANVQLAHLTCNLRKGARLADVAA